MVEPRRDETAEAVLVGRLQRVPQPRFVEGKQQEFAELTVEIGGADYTVAAWGEAAKAASAIRPNSLVRLTADIQSRPWKIGRRNRTYLLLALKTICPIPQSTQR
jgi:hypothetical protein